MEGTDNYLGHTEALVRYNQKLVFYENHIFTIKGELNGKMLLVCFFFCLVDVGLSKMF